MLPLIDLTGQKFGHWTVIERGPNDSEKKPQWICKCLCGDVKNIRGKTLREGSSTGCRDCQIKRSMFRHGLSRSPTYKIWAYMIARCHNPKDTAYKYYGAKGITVCKRWREDFLNFLNDMGERPSGLSIDRIDNYKGYSKNNCRWATRQEQTENTRRYIKNGTQIVNWILIKRCEKSWKGIFKCVLCNKKITFEIKTAKKRKCFCSTI